ncbi:MAG: MAPEG family protein [Sphingomonas sp.]|nr:MAPEG family protein [Sphingomonas sp.]
MTALPITLLSAAAAVGLNIWLGYRIANLRELHKVSVGDGGHDALLRRMRAQSNYIENAPFFLILLGALESSGGDFSILAAAAVIFFLARIAHAIGMDGGVVQRWRTIGMAGQMIALIALAIYALIKAIGAL